jgi:hypothetical protein
MNSDATHLTICALSGIFKRITILLTALETLILNQLYTNKTTRSLLSGTQRTLLETSSAMSMSRIEGRSWCSYSALCGTSVGIGCWISHLLTAVIGRLKLALWLAIMASSESEFERRACGLLCRLVLTSTHACGLGVHRSKRQLSSICA